MESISTRVGTSSRAMRAAASSPFRPGSVMSSRMASGGSRRTSSTASSPSPVSPTTSTPGRLSSSARMPARTRAWSSASRMRRRAIMTVAADSGAGPGPGFANGTRYLDAAAGAGARVQLDRAAGVAHPLGHAEEPEVLAALDALADSLGIETDAVVLDDELAARPIRRAA